MKLFKKLFTKISFAFSVLFLSIFSQVSFGAEVTLPSKEQKQPDDEMGKIIILAGPSCSGKTTIAKEICAKFGFKYVSQDEFSDAEVAKAEKYEMQAKLDTEQDLAIKKAKNLAAKGFVVVCDIVPLNSQDQPILEEIIQQTTCYPTYKIFVHTPYDQLMQQVEKRNILAKQSNSPEEARSPYSVTMQWAESYKPADTKTSPSKKIPVKMKSPDTEKKFVQASPPDSPLLESRLLGTVQRNLFPNKEQEILCITPIEKYDYVFQNNKYDSKTLKPVNLPVLIFAIQEWLKTATQEWEKSLDDKNSSDSD